MSLSARIGGAWKTLEPSVKIGGAWKALDLLAVKVAGVWETIYEAAVLNFSNATASTTALAPNDAVATVQFANTGQCVVTVGADFAWLTNGTASNYDIYVSGTGDALASGTLNTWLNLGTSRSWTLAETGTGTKSWTGTYQIGLAGTATAINSGTLSLSATVEAS